VAFVCKWRRRGRHGRRPGPRLVPPTFDPTATPIPHRLRHPGDAVIPAWSARLVSLPDDQVITVRPKGDDEHMTMMNSSPVQTAI
jgi:hypothetical protein